MRCITFVCLIAAQTTGGELVSKDGVLSVKGADAATLYVSVATNFKNFRDVSGDEHARAVEKLETAIKVPYETAKAAHSAFYREQADRCTLYLGRDPQPGATTFRRLAIFPETNDPSLVALFFRFGRYLMIELRHAAFRRNLPEPL